ncbi:MAG: glycerate kinase [Pseudanabaena sp.]|jgi:D-glycerate 3-kinase|uniref:glycerate kinase n=1 Tax=Pseudanabaena mucicola TaxID=71190 RepID=UPI002574CE2E|nr:glycerate kinase [Pseudanabaena mucicola]MCA6574498.1 glycerate kinase [Pseudanabaena sp. M53BS1SP1A06MG]MCA6583368.1 glycerate kinase [Pseudanabaena sp. M34BS1SP1A06MG]MCA6593425.1 glycerate kinase [Pseudanabaena sp. M38BS1SP1A06MG]MCA6596114.1 glycerate kinase [Pseudanabaena sp. M046S1SP1A06QC]MCA6602297.1 glycerate kinase [Pseudanabaena sp. M57BS1SP1A06MG]MCA6610929.1 glycerate kinase [Pseudanabaena sp. M158S2SP1A06QC]
MFKNQVIRIIELIGQGYRLSELDDNLLRQDLLETNKHLQAIDNNALSDLGTHEIDAIIRQRSHLLQLAYPEISQVIVKQNIQLDHPSDIFTLLWYYWIPLARKLAHQQQKLGRPLIQGLLGGQGAGKTTLGLVLNILLKHLGKTFLSISLDDFYKTYTDRQKLRERRPVLIWRGPPSTHDVDLGIQVLQQLRDRYSDQPQPTAIPRFDKSLHNGAGDRIGTEISHGADIVVFEGWFVGMRPLPISAFRHFIPPILSESDLEFALECNANLYNYLPLWDYLDSLIVLIPENYQYSLQWRLEAEHKLIASGKTGMSDHEITQFVEYFWKALHPELFLPRMLGHYNINERLLGEPISPIGQINGDHIGADPPVDLVIEISRSRLPQRIYRP